MLDYESHTTYILRAAGTHVQRKQKTPGFMFLVGGVAPQVSFCLATGRTYIFVMQGGLAEIHVKSQK